MKIADVRVFPVANFVYVKIETDEGVHGIGEASLSGRTHAVVGAFQQVELRVRYLRGVLAQLIGRGEGVVRARTSSKGVQT